MFTSNDTPAEEYVKAKQLGAIINLDDVSHISYLDKYAGMPELICFRYNPGPLREGNEIIGDPKEAKYGVTTDQIQGRLYKGQGAGRREVRPAHHGGLQHAGRALPDRDRGDALQVGRHDIS